MRKQLVIKIPDGAKLEEIEAIMTNITQSYTSGYPLYIFPGWKYDVVELSDPVLTMRDEKSYPKIHK